MEMNDSCVWQCVFARRSFLYARRKLSGHGVRILDIGCGNNSPVTTRRWFPGSHYSGVDIQRYNLNDQGLAAMDTFYLLDPDGEGYSAIPDQQLQLHRSSPRRGAYAKSDADSGSDLL
jgi:hypothetical protein